MNVWRLRVLALLLAGCVEPTAVLEPGRGADAGRVDAAVTLDAGAQPDRGAGMARDLGPADVLVPDRGAVDVGVWDLGLLDAALHAIPGVLEHGLFLGMAGLTVVGEADGSTRTIAHR